MLLAGDGPERNYRHHAEVLHFFLVKQHFKSIRENRPKTPLFSSLKFLVKSIGRNGNASRNTSLSDDLKNAKPEFVESLFCQAVIVLVVIKFASNFSIASQKQNASNVPGSSLGGSGPFAANGCSYAQLGRDLVRLLRNDIF